MSQTSQFATRSEANTRRGLLDFFWQVSWTDVNDFHVANYGGERSISILTMDAGVSVLRKRPAGVR